MEFKPHLMLLPVLLAALFLFSCAEGPTGGDDNGDDLHDDDDTTGVEGAYLDQTPPGRTFVRFAPGVITEEMIHSITVSPDGREIYWAERNGIMVTRLVDGHWTPRARASFSPGRTDFYDDAPVLSPDNTRLYFNSRRPSGYTVVAGFGFWYCDRTASGWSEPRELPAVISETGGIHWQVSVSDAGTLYFGIISATAVEIYASRLVNGTYQTPEPQEVINNVGWVICPFIARDESYLIFNKIDDGGARSDYYISFRGNDGQWLTPQRLTQFPSGESSFVTRDGQYVFCKSYWASAQLIEDLRPE